MEVGIKAEILQKGSSSPVSIWWIRRDLRLSDNQALNAALIHGKVIPIFIMDNHLLRRPAEKRQAFLFAGLRALQEELQRHGSGIVVRRGDPVQEVPRLAAEVGAQTVYAEADISPYSRQRDTAVGKNVNLQLVGGPGAQPVTAVSRADGKPYTVFTPYRGIWKSLPFGDNSIAGLDHRSDCFDSSMVDMAGIKGPGRFPAGESEAQRRLAEFLDGPIYEYHINRDRMDLDGTSALSPYLHLGMLSARQAVASVRQLIKDNDGSTLSRGPEIWLNELIWREFFNSILFHFPHVLRGPFRLPLKSYPWRNAPQDLIAWKEGMTGYPVVDAGMRQLTATGWMHNRARMITSSFLVKHLLIDWREGERWFMQNLIDGDLASNNGGWQWVAGTGTDAAPYFRIFNPVLQGKKYDPKGDYVRRWVPELARVPAKWIHTPWEMPTDIQRETGVRIGKDYPAPIVEHAAARERALKTYYGLKQ